MGTLSKEDIHGQIATLIEIYHRIDGQFVWQEVG
jgi:hypothetical protein